MKLILQVRDLTKSFGGVVANDAISLDVPKGAIVGLIGPNGSGKTTLFNAIAGAFPIDRGSICLKGNEVSTKLTAEIARAGLIRTFQQPRIFSRMSALDNMLVSASIRQAEVLAMLKSASAKDSKRATDLLDFVGLAAKRDLEAGSLSYGQQKLLELAMALMNDPELLLLDEPTAGINPVLIESLIERLRAANRERGLTLLVIEHNMPVIMGLAQCIYCLAHGRLLAQGTPHQIRNNKRVVDAYLGAA
jgi:ABC-type branched-subunit amino acid transport system ATPase component